MEKGKNSIRGAVFSIYNSISDFANAVGWKHTKASRIVNGIQKPSAKDMEQMAPYLHATDAETFVSIFFPSLSTK